MNVSMMKFAWDENKNKININKHGISFAKASLVFQDENRIETFDENHSYSEDRFKIIGKVDDVLCVIVTYRDDDVIRIISARAATKNERRDYEWQWSLKQWKKS